MNDLISRSALKNHIMNYTGMFTDELGFAVSLAQVIMAIENAPKVDAVELVRCDECAFAQNFRSAYVDCKCWRSSVPRDGFCYNGERKMDLEVSDGKAKTD